MSALLPSFGVNSRERLNSQIHMCYVKKDFLQCLSLIEQQLKSCNGLSEYPLYIKGLILRQEGRVDESLVLFQAALGLNPMSVSIMKQVGRSFYLLGKHRAALEVYSEAEQLSSEDKDIWYYKGMCYLYMKDYDRAIDSFETSNSIQKNENAYIQLGRVHRLLGKDEAALDIYLEALEVCPENSELLTTIGLLYLKLQQNGRAFEMLGNSLTFDPKNPKTILAAGSIIQDNQDMDVALIKYRVAMTQSPNSCQLWNNIGMCLFGKGKLVAAIACLKHALYLGPFEWIISYNLGVVHLSTGQYVSSFQHFSTAINLQPTYAKAYLYLAVSLSKLDDFQNCSSAYAKAIELGDDYLVRLNYSITLYLNDEVESAKEQFARFRELLAGEASADVDPDAKEQAAVLEKLLGL